MKFLKTIRFDPSDMHVFEYAAEPDEWAVPGGFWFGGIEQSTLKGKIKQAFSNGFLSIDSFGFSTFTSVTEIGEPQLELNIEKLATRFHSDFGAPDMETARSAAREETDYVVEMCAEVPINSIFAIRRMFDETGTLHESYSLVEAPGEQVHTKIWEIVE